MVEAWLRSFFHSEHILRLMDVRFRKSLITGVQRFSIWVWELGWLKRDCALLFRTDSSSDGCLLKFEVDSFQFAGWLDSYDALFLVCVMKTDSDHVRGLSPADVDFIFLGALTLSNLPVDLFLYDSIFHVCVCQR